MKVLQINSVANSGSTGRIAEEIGNVLLDHDHESFVAYGRGNAKSNSHLIKIGSDKDVYLHGAHTLLTDHHGYASKRATQSFVKEVRLLKPDLIVLHNLHGYYLHLPTLFDFLIQEQLPVVWTLFDCWAFTGHCTYFDDINCLKWETQCHSCPKHKNYPRSLVDNSTKNFMSKKLLFQSLERLEIVTHSKWLGDLVGKSFLSNYPVHITPSAINLNLFKNRDSDLRERYQLGSKKVILGCASAWTNRKGYDDFIQLSKILDKDQYQIVMIGLNFKELRNLPEGILGLQRTESVEQLAKWYSLAFCFVNPTTQDNFPTTNLEALACGTPVITYNTGGSPESIDAHTGYVVSRHDVPALKESIRDLEIRDYEAISIACRERAEKLYDRNSRYLDYLKIFSNLIERTKI